MISGYIPEILLSLGIDRQGHNLSNFDLSNEAQSKSLDFAGDRFSLPKGLASAIFSPREHRCWGVSKAGQA